VLSKSNLVDRQQSHRGATLIVLITLTVIAILEMSVLRASAHAPCCKLADLRTARRRGYQVAGQPGSAWTPLYYKALRGTHLGSGEYGLPQYAGRRSEEVHRNPL
jgi:hypothetical protein